MHALFFEKVLIILREHTKHANFKLGVQYPLNKKNEKNLKIKRCYVIAGSEMRNRKKKT